MQELTGLAELTTFVRARLDEREKAARKTSDEEYLRNVGFSTTYDSVDHAELYTPSRILREIDAARQLIDFAEYIGGWTDEHSFYVTQHEIQSMRRAGREALCRLALPHDDHEDYQEDWRR